MPNKPGAQPRNTNALQHGFYSSSSTSTEWEDLPARSADSLEGEITALRLLLLRLAGHPDPDPDPLDTGPYNPFNVIVTATARLSLLVRTQQQLIAAAPDSKFPLKAAVTEYWLEQGLAVYRRRLTPEYLENLRLKLRSAR